MILMNARRFCRNHPSPRILIFAILGLTACSKGPDVPDVNCPGNVCIINPDSPAPNYPPLSAVITIVSPAASGPNDYPGTAFAFYGTGNGGSQSYTAGSWSFGDGTTGSGLSNVTHSYTAAGTYTVTFTVTDSKAFTASTTTTVMATTASETVVYTFFNLNADTANSLITGTDGNFYGTTPTDSAGLGSVFELKPAGTLTTLYSLNPSNPADGCGTEGLTEGADGNFYGTTYTCGTYGGGNVFVVSPSGTETDLHAFCSGTDGCNPKASLIQAANGNFYGTTANGGTHGFGTVFMMTTSGAETVLYSFGTSGTDGESPLRLVQGADGNFYGTTTEGGAYALGTVFEVTPTGLETVLCSFGTSTTDGAKPNNLLQGSDGNLYGTTSGGGTHGLGTVFKITPAGVETVLYSFGASATDGQSPSDLIQGKDGNLYGSTYSGGSFSGGALFEITPTGTMTMLYASFGATISGSSCSGGGFNPPNGANPIGITFGSDGAIYGFTAGGYCSGTNPATGHIFRVAL